MLDPDTDLYLINGKEGSGSFLTNGKVGPRYGSVPNQWKSRIRIWICTYGTGTAYRNQHIFRRSAAHTVQNNLVWIRILSFSELFHAIEFIAFMT